jgi:hypothetical protein
VIRIKPILRNPHNDKQADTLLDALIGAPPAEAGARSFREDLPRLSSAALYRELIVLCLRRRWPRAPAGGGPNATTESPRSCT